MDNDEKKLIFLVLISMPVALVIIIGITFLAELLLEVF